MGRHSTLERLDDAHRATATGTWWCFGLIVIGNSTVLLVFGEGVYRHMQELSAERELRGAMSVGEQPIMSNAMEALRKDVQ
jgi:hypothetical protein